MLLTRYPFVYKQYADDANRGRGFSLIFLICVDRRMREAHNLRHRFVSVTSASYTVSCNNIDMVFYRKQ